LDLEVFNDGLSFEIVKSEIKNLAAAGLVGLLADPLLTFSTGDFLKPKYKNGGP
jgi:hypothetical protein